MKTEQELRDMAEHYELEAERCREELKESTPRNLDRIKSTIKYIEDRETRASELRWAIGDIE